MEMNTLHDKHDSGCCCSKAQEAHNMQSSAPDRSDLLHHVGGGVQVNQALVDPAS